jgi:hypothetical protein
MPERWQVAISDQNASHKGTLTKAEDAKDFVQEIRRFVIFEAS